MLEDLQFLEALRAVEEVLFERLPFGFGQMPLHVLLGNFGGLYGLASHLDALRIFITACDFRWRTSSGLSLNRSAMSPGLRFSTSAMMRMARSAASRVSMASTISRRRFSASASRGLVL